MSEYVVEMHNIDKRFAAVHAVDDGEFTLKKGEIHSLVGENGAGKSTMMKMLYGIYEPDGGTITVSGKKIHEMTPKTAIKHGIGMVHQEFMLSDNLTVLENIILGFEPRKWLTINFDKARAIIQKYIETYHMDVQPDKKITQISVGEAQRVEIIKTLYRGADVLILDEPTAVLTPQECRKFFEILDNLRADNKSIVFISHKLNEVMQVSDRITVMRGGKHVDTVKKENTTVAQLAKMMVGREVFLNVDRAKVRVGNPILEVKGLWTSGEKELSKIRGISFDVCGGEVVGIAGVDGNGQNELIEAIAGLRKVERGNVFIDGTDITNLSPRKIRQAGITHIPEDRNLRGLNRGMSVADNLIAWRTDQKPYCTFEALHRKKIREFAEELIGRYDIRPRNSDNSAEGLSGGNAQKVVVAREVDADGKLLIAAQPSRGVDIGAIEYIRKVLMEVKRQGKAVLLVSADLDEILSLSDRIVVMYEGRIMGIVNTEDANEDNLGLLMMGEAPQGFAEKGAAP